MIAILLVHFGSANNEKEVGPLLNRIFKDKNLSVFQNPFIRKIASIILPTLVKRASINKYRSIGFDKSYGKFIEQLVEKIGSATHLQSFEASSYGRPSLEDALTKIDAAQIDNVTVVPFYPHSSVEIYQSIFDEIERLTKLYFRGIHFKWTGPFFDHPLFIEAWAQAIQESLNQFSNRQAVHLLFSAHALPITNPAEGIGSYKNQVEHTVSAILQSLAVNNPTSLAYQSASRLGRWSSPRIDDEIARIASGGGKSLLIVPISFLFDNMETLFDIDKVAIPRALKMGFRSVCRVKPPSNSQKIIDMLVDIISSSNDKH